MRKRLKNLDRIKNDGHNLQHILLLRLVKTATRTVWGKNYGYNKIKSYQDFASVVPLQDYTSMLPHINSIRKGHQNILWPTEIKWFAKSSGTASGKSKFIPVSHEAIEHNHFAGGKDLLALYCNIHPETNLFGGYSLRLGGSTAVNSKNHETYFGDLSAVLIENFPFWVEMRSTPNQRIALMDEWECKIDLIARQAIRQNVTSLWGVNSWFLVLLHKVLELTGKKNILEVWPNLQLFAHGGVSFAPYEQQFKALMPGNQVTFIETYNASEGFFAIQDTVPHQGMLLLTNHGIFYEFIPMSSFAGTNSATIPLSEVALGVYYALVISTNAGLWRYIVGDTVKFTSINPYRIVITGRVKNYINAFGEELIIENAEEGLRIACEKTGAMIVDFIGAPVYMANNQGGAHEWMIEFVQMPNDMGDFEKSFDAALQSLNSDYEAKRYKNMALRAPIIHIARKGLFMEWLKRKGKLGGQHKVPRLMNDRSIIDELLVINQQI